MTAEQVIKADILRRAIAEGFGEPWEGGEITEANVNVAWDTVNIDGDLYDYVEEFRSNYDEETQVDCPYSRHYESKSVAKKLPIGKWIGWTYWYGGGKHGEPEAIDWMDEAYFLNVKEEEKLVVVREFSKVEPASY